MLTRYISSAALVLLTACVSSPPTQPTKVVADTAAVEPIAIATASPATKALTTANSAPGKPAPVSASLPAKNKAEFDRGVAALNAGNFGEAVLVFASVQKQVPDYVPAYLNASLAERGRGHLEEAYAQIELALAHGLKDARLYNLSGLIERERGHFKEARIAYETALQIDDNFAQAHRNFAVLADYYLHDAPLALLHLERFAQLQSNEPLANNWLAELRRRVGVKPENKP